MKDLSKKPIIFDDQCWRILYCPIVDLIKSLKKVDDFVNALDQSSADPKWKSTTRKPPLTDLEKIRELMTKNKHLNSEDWKWAKRWNTKRKSTSRSFKQCN